MSAIFICPRKANLRTLLAEFLHGNDGPRKHTECHGSYFPVLIKYDAGESDEGEEIFNNAGDGVRDRGLNKINITGDTGNQGAGRSFAEKRDGEALKVGIKLVPDVPNHT